MKINELRIEPHIVKPDTTKERYRGAKEGFVVWKISIDGNLLTDTARPFKSTDAIIELKTNIQYPFWFDGEWYVSVRRIGNYVMWYSNLEFDLPYYKPWDKDETGFQFDIHRYETACEDANKKSADLNLALSDFMGKSPQSNQILQPEELTYLLLLNFPDFYDAIYLEPHNPQDTTGKFFIRKMKNALEQITEFTICEPPEKEIELRIGLEETPFTEAIWRIGKINGQFAIYFEQSPYFPVWLQSPAFDKVFAEVQQ